MDTTLALINTLAHERFALYCLSGKRQLTVQQRWRIRDITLSLPELWAQYRRELAALRNPKGYAG